MRIGRLRTLAVMLVLTGAAGIGVAGWLAGARTVTLPDAPGRLDCASYVPPRFDAGAGAVLRSELDTQLALVARHFSCIRTYSSEGAADIPDAARRAGLKVMLGAWISGHGPTNRREIERTVALANAHRDVIDSVIVGNEVFLRGELPAGELAKLITEVRNRTGLPVTTADIWAFWPEDPALLAAVSFVTVHILPYWDDEPASPERAMEHVAAVYADLQVRFAGHEVRIGETGWPTAGRQRGALAPGRVNAARYLREFTAWASARGIRYNLIEAFDQPWKRTHEGTVGGYWGLFDAQHRARFPLAGPMVADPGWRIGLALAVAGGLLVPLVLVRTRSIHGGPAVLAATLAGIGAGSLLLHQWRYLVAANRNLWEWAATLAWTGAGWMVAATGLLALITALHPGTAGPDRPQPVVGPTPSPRPDRGWWIVLIGAAWISGGLALAGRHRDFPVALLLPAVMGLVLIAIARPAHLDQPGPARRWRIPEVGLLLLLLATAPVILWQEGFANTHAVAWVAATVALVVAAWGPR